MRKPDALKLAALEGRAADVRRLAAEDPSALDAGTPDGVSLVDLARGRGDALAEVTLLRLKAHDAGDLADWRALLRKCMMQLCHRLSGASWVGEMEFAVWRAVVKGEPLPEDEDPHGFSRLDAQTVADLRFLVKRCDGWFAWDEGSGNVAFVPRQEWVRRYAAWLRDRHPPDAPRPGSGS